MIFLLSILRFKLAWTSPCKFLTVHLYSPASFGAGSYKKKDRTIEILRNVNKSKAVN